MAEYIIKSKTLSVLSNALKKIMLTEYNAVTTPPEMDDNGNFTSKVQTEKEPKVVGVDIEQKVNELSNDEIVSQAIEKIRNSVDVASDLEEIIKQIIEKNGGIKLSNEWKINDDHNDVYLQSKDAHIFQQNNEICLSHDGKIEVFDTVEKLHKWLGEHNWPLPPAMKIHESKETLTETARKSICRAWNLLVDYANGYITYDPETNMLISKEGKRERATDSFLKGLRDIQNGQLDFERLKNSIKFNNTTDIKDNDASVQDHIDMSDKRHRFALLWVSGIVSGMAGDNVKYQKNISNGKLSSALVQASNSKDPIDIKINQFSKSVNADNFQSVLYNICNQTKNKELVLKFLNDLQANNDLSQNNKEYIQSLIQAVQNFLQNKANSNRRESVDIEKRVSSLLESSKKFPWLNNMINQHLIKEDDTASSALNSFDNSVASAGGMETDTSATDNTSSTETDTSSTEDGSLGNFDLGADDNSLGGNSSGGLGGGSFNLNLNGDENQQLAPDNGETYVAIDMTFPDKKDTDEDDKNYEIKVKLKNLKTGEIIEKSLNQIDTM